MKRRFRNGTVLLRMGLALALVVMVIVGPGWRAELQAEVEKDCDASTQCCVAYHNCAVDHLEMPALDKMVERLACEARAQRAVEDCQDMNSWFCAIAGPLAGPCERYLGKECVNAGEYARSLCSQ
jgi:hypothetical protein